MSIPTPMLLISRDINQTDGVPVTVSDDCFTSAVPGRVVSSNYTQQYRSCNAQPSSGSPIKISLDLSGVTTAKRKKILVCWYNDPTTGAYDWTAINAVKSNLPQDYVIQGNPGAGGGSPPANGWVDLVTVTGNNYHSRQHYISDFTSDGTTPYNWLRMSVSASQGGGGNTDVAVKIDVHNVANGIEDDILVAGDSITSQGFLHTNYAGATVAQLINAQISTNYPVVEDAGIVGWTSASPLEDSGDSTSWFDHWLIIFPGKYVCLNFGTNDANNASVGDPNFANNFLSNMTSLANKVVAAGKIPIVPLVLWGRTTNLQTNVPILNAQIQTLYSNIPQILHGPDLYSYFNAHQDFINTNDNIHPTLSDTTPGIGDGYEAYRQQWVSWFVQNIYTETSTLQGIVQIGGRRRGIFAF